MRPLTEGLTAELDSKFTVEALRLAIEGKVVEVFVDEEARG